MPNPPIEISGEDYYRLTSRLGLCAHQCHHAAVSFQKALKLEDPEYADKSGILEGLAEKSFGAIEDSKSFNNALNQKGNIDGKELLRLLNIAKESLEDMYESWEIWRPKVEKGHDNPASLYNATETTFHIAFEELDRFESKWANLLPSHAENVKQRPRHTHGRHS